jgi:hypothetical protein
MPLVRADLIVASTVRKRLRGRLPSEGKGRVEGKAGKEAGR